MNTEPILIDINKIFNYNNINSAWELVKTKKSGGGIDRISVNDFNENYKNRLQELLLELTSSAYVPEPYERILIRKQNKSEFRPIGMLSVKDKIVQTVITDFYSNSFEKIFLDSSYAYRKLKGHSKAVRRVKDYLARKMNFILAVDIDNFFDTIDRDLLFEKCKKYFNNPYIESLIKMWVKTGVVYKEKYIDQTKGIAQGGVISPLLSNLYLHDLDLLMRQSNIPNVRYADNIILFGKSPDSLNAAFITVNTFLENNLHLKLNPSKNTPVNASEGFVFCGIYFKDNLLTICSKKMDSIKSYIRNIAKDTPLKILAQTLNPHLEGLQRYYRFFDVKEQFAELHKFITTSLSIRYKKEINAEPASKEIILEQLKKIIILDEDAAAVGVKKFIESVTANTSNPPPAPKEIPDKVINRKIYNKKQSYKKVWYENTEVVICNPNTQIGQSLNKFTIRKDGKVFKEVLSNKTKNIMISAKGVTISSNAVKLAADNNVKIDYFDALGVPYASIVPSIAPVSEIVNNQFEAANGKKGKIIAKELIIAKIKNQASLIKYFIKNKENSKKEEYLIDIQKMEEFIKKIRTLSMNLEIDDMRDKILGYEGISASYYWGALKRLIPPDYGFTEREHQNAKNIVNSALNYAYGILYSRVLNVVTLAGLNSNIAFLHREQRNKPVLIFDIIEPFRAPVAERTIFAMCSKNVKFKCEKNGLLAEESRSKIAKNVLLRLNKEIIYKGKEISLNDIMLNSAYNIAEFLTDKIKTFKTFTSKW